MLPQEHGGKKLLVIGHTWPEPSTTGAGVRMEQLLLNFLRAGYSINFACAAERSTYSMDLPGIGIHTSRIELNNTSFDEFISQCAPDIVLYDRFMIEEQYGWRVREQLPDALQLLDTEDLHSLRAYRRTCIKKGIDFSKPGWLETDLCKRELASILRCDLSLIISGYETSLLQEIGIPGNILIHLPFLPEFSGNKTAGFDSRDGFAFIGNGKHQPNIDAILQLKEIWPELRKELPGTNLHIYGAYLPDHIRLLNRAEHGFLVHGWVENGRKALEQHRVQLAPLQFGAGQKGKILQAMQAGTPTVTTKIGAEGICEYEEFPGRVVEDTAAFIRAAKALYSNPSEWIPAHEAAEKVLLKYFRSESQAENFIQKLQELQTTIRAHRASNIYGSILRHQSLGASRYLSKYIELKNKNRDSNSNSPK